MNKYLINGALLLAISVSSSYSKLSLDNPEELLSSLSLRDRIAQLIISPVVHVETEFIDKIPEETKRGAGGFGSTGK